MEGSRKGKKQRRGGRRDGNDVRKERNVGGGRAGERPKSSDVVRERSRE